MAKFTVQSLKIKQALLTSYNVGINILFLKKEKKKKKEYIVLVTGNVYKVTYFKEFTH